MPNRTRLPDAGVPFENATEVNPMGTGIAACDVFYGPFAEPNVNHASGKYRATVARSSPHRDSDNARRVR